MGLASDPSIRELIVAAARLALLSVARPLSLRVRPHVGWITTGIHGLLFVLQSFAAWVAGRDAAGSV